MLCPDSGPESQILSGLPLLELNLVRMKNVRVKYIVRTLVQRIILVRMTVYGVLPSPDGGGTERRLVTPPGPDDGRERHILRRNV